MANPHNASLIPGVPGSENSGKGSKTWTAVKPGIVLGLKTTEKALDGLPIPGAKGCVGLILHFINTADIASDNICALETLQNRFESLQDVLSPIYANKAVDIPEDVRKDVENLARKLDKLAAQWKPKLGKTHKKRHFFRRLLNAEADRDTLAGFVTAVDQTVQDFLVSVAAEIYKSDREPIHIFISSYIGNYDDEWKDQIAAFREDIKNREARTLHLLPRAPAASYDSVRTGGANACLEGTRTTILQTIRTWATAADPSLPPMFWLNGLAGIGKTTIAHTIAAELDEAGLLGASFVFLRADDQLKDARLVFPTIAFQLAHHNPLYKTCLVEVLELDPDCGSKRLDLQFEKLILQPFSSVPLSSPIILILDALDECDPETLTKELLRIIHRNIQKVPFLRVFITSRPEGYIREALDLVDPTAPHEKLVLHEDIHADEVEHDIRLFLQVNLQELWNKRTKQTSVQWPGEKDLEILVKQSGKLFVHAATALRFMGENPTWDLERQLSVLLNVPVGHVPTGEPYQQLDGLYLQILKGAIADRADNYYVERFWKIVGSIALIERPLPLLSLSIFLNTDPDLKSNTAIIRGTLYHLQSIIIVPASDNEPPRTYHLSFPNFITTAERCTDKQAYINPSRQAKYLFLRCVDTMKKQYGVRSSSTSDTDTTSDRSEDAPSIQSSVGEPDDRHANSRRSSKSHVSLEDDLDNYDLSPEMRYSERYWCRHLTNVPVGHAEVVAVFEGFIACYISEWLTDRTDRILNNVRDNQRLTADTFDIIHNAYRWGASSECKPQCLSALKRLAKDAFALIFPDRNIRYEFGKRLDPDIGPTMNHRMGIGKDLPSQTSLAVQYTDDVALETQYLRRRCFNCHMIEALSWRRSTLNPGKILCSKCGLYERTHLRHRPLRFDELRLQCKANRKQPKAEVAAVKESHDPLTSP